MARARSLITLVVVIAASSYAYVPYWTDYWLPNSAYQDVQPEGYLSKYPYHPREHHEYPYPPPYPHQQTRGEDAYPGRFLGMGAINSHFGGRQVELICSLHEGDGKIVSNVVWTKVKGAYPHPGNPQRHDCPKCTYFPINYDDHRIKAYDYHGKSILFIHEVHKEDYGIYRCSATAQVSYRGDIETVYQIVKL